MAEEVDHLDLNFCKQCHTNKTKLISSCRSLVVPVVLLNIALWLPLVAKVAKESLRAGCYSRVVTRQWALGTQQLVYSQKF